ncbi:Protein FAR1-RELATED SEQUENCE 11, partial [Bienertia sinuspersici]
TMPMLNFDLNDTLTEEDDYEPFIGQTFKSQEEAYAYYNKYAKCHGYVVRKDRSNTKDGMTVVDLSKSQRHRESSRCECKAHMRITLKRCFDIFPEEWHVTNFVKEHNHELLSPEEMRFLPSNRTISQEEEKQILLYKEVGFSVRQIIRVMELEKDIKHGELSFIERDVRNLFHIQGLQNVQRFWAPAYLRDHFFGGMITTGRSESINAFIKKFVSSNVSLIDFVKQVDMVVQEIDQGRVHNNMIATLRPISVKSKSPLEEQAFKVLTPYAFKKFQEEFFRANILKGQLQDIIMFFWDGVTTSCSCKIFEFWGILCRHILRVFSHRDCFKIPTVYLPLRWHHKTLSSSSVGVNDLYPTSNVIQNTCDVEEGHTSATNSVVEGEDIIMMEEEVDLMDQADIDDNTLHLPPKSMTKGHPKKRREKGGKELEKKSKCCSICKEPGHTKPTCPHKENISDLNGMKNSDSSSQKRQKGSIRNESSLYFEIFKDMVMLPTGAVYK